MVIDFAQITPANLSAGKMPAGMEMLTKGLALSWMRPPSAYRYATHGEWPHTKARVSSPTAR